MDEASSQALEESIRFYADLHQEVESPPCGGMLRGLGPRGVRVVAELMRDSIHEGDASVAGYCVDLLAHSDLPGSVEALTDMLAAAIGVAPLPDEILEELFDDAVQYDRFLGDPRFLSTARALIGRWNNSQFDQFLAVAERRLHVN